MSDAVLHLPVVSLTKFHLSDNLLILVAPNCVLVHVLELTL